MIGSPRRFYLLKALAAKARGELALAAVWEAKQLEQEGASLPAEFPARAKLVAAGYVALEDIHGAEPAELTTNASLSMREAIAALAAATT